MEQPSSQQSISNQKISAKDRTPSKHSETELQLDQPWHTFPTEQTVELLSTDSTQGLPKLEANRRLQIFGPNELTRGKGRTLLSIFIDQFKSLIVILLIFATFLAFSLQDYVEGIAILVVIVLNSGIGFFTEWKAEEALSALRKQTVPVALVIRNGEQQQIPAAELVPGDLAILQAGDRVPADGRVIESVQLQLQEAALTGESVAVGKETAPLEDPDAPLADRSNMAFMGTVITSGRGKVLITATGSQTEVGKIGLMLEESDTESTPLEKKLDELGRVLVFVVLVLCAVIVLAGWLRGATDLWQMMKVGISLAIAAVPEGLPAVATMTLAIGMQRMARKKALIRRLPAVETLGSTTVICTDKTGTLTKNEMTVQVLVLDNQTIEITGGGYRPEGEFLHEGTPFPPRKDKDLILALRIGLLCNDAQIERPHQKQKDQTVTVIGDPTEAALIVSAEKAGLDPHELKKQYPREAETPFDSTVKRMSTVHRTPEGELVEYVKGAPDEVLKICSTELIKGEPRPLSQRRREEWKQMNHQMAASALRVLAVAYRELPESYNHEKLDQELAFIGLVGMIDPVRDEAVTAVATCREAGIRIVMITGDQKDTAEEIAHQLRLHETYQGRRLRVVHGRELSHLDPSGWQNVVSDTGVYARVSPRDKLEIVQALQKQHHIVAMTGDGVNDAPALKKANIGVAMGIKGTEVAKQTSDMIILDDNFATIVSAVEQGRIIYTNILKFIHYLFSCNLSEILTIFFAILIGWPLPLGALQLLWLNMITDVFPALALALEPSVPDMMKQPPRDPRESLINRSLVSLISWQGILLSGVTLFAFFTALQWYGETEEGQLRATTITFMTLALSQVFHTFNARSRHRSIFTSRLLTNGWLWGAVVLCILLQVAAISVPLLRRVLDTTIPTYNDWLLIVGCSLTPVAVVELAKLIRKLFKI